MMSFMYIIIDCICGLEKKNRFTDVGILTNIWSANIKELPRENEKTLHFDRKNNKNEKKG